MFYPFLRLSPILLLFFACANGQRRSTDPRSQTPTTDTSALHGSAGAAPRSLPDGRDRTATIERAAATSAASGRDAGAASEGGSATMAIPRAATLPDRAVSTTAARDAANGADGKSEVESVPTLHDASGNTLPQTEALPSLDSPSFQRRMELLFQAIVKDDPQIAAPAFFPVAAYEQVKDVAQPARDWKYRLMAAFAQNIHEYHLRLGKGRAQARLLGVEPPAKSSVRWMKPGSEGNRLGYHRALRAKLKVVHAGGREQPLEITSMISWRGEWYVVHLNGFK